MKKLRYLILMLLVLLLTACRGETMETTEVPELEAGQIYTFFVNKSRTDVYPVPYTIEDSEVPQMVYSIIQSMANENGTMDYQTPIPNGITYVSNEYDKVQNSVKISFNVVYDSINAESLLFFKTCVSWTLLQLEEVENVSIALTDVANPDEETATTVESFDRNSFTMNFGDRSGYKQTGTIVLYFANANGDMLKEYQKTVEISNTTSLSRLVIESLIHGPEEEGYIATLSDEVKINNISVNDGICYVDLSDEFYDTANPLKNDIIVYSVVNSLVELPTVSKVQFLKNGEKQMFFRETMPFDAIFERNLDLVEQEEES